MHDVDAIVGFLLITGDCMIVGIIMSLLGFWRKEVHNYSLSVLILVHGIFSCIQTHYLVNNRSPFNKYADFFSTTQMMLRVTIPCSLLFITSFRHFMFFCVPLTLIPHQVIIIWTEKAFRNEIENCAESSVMPADYSTQLQTTRDFFLILCVSIGLHSHSSTLIRNFILTQKSIR